MVRLADSDDMSYGRLEVRYNNTWGTVCQRGFTMKSANVVCKQLGYLRGAINFTAGAIYGPSNSTVWLSRLRCLGNESNIAACPHSYWGKTDCTHAEDISITCNPGTINEY